MKWQTLVCVMLCGLMFSGCVVALGTKQYSCPFEDQHEQWERDPDAHFEELEMHEGEYAEFPPDEQEAHLEERMRELEMRAEQLNEMERHLAERAQELERRAAELEEREQ